MQPPRRPNNNQGNNPNRGGGMMPRQNNNKNRYNNNRNNNQNRGGGQNAGGRINISQVTNQRDKYLNHAKDAQHSGDRVVTEYYLQHADHYQRLINEYNEEQESRRAQFSPPQENSPEDTDSQAEGAPDNAAAGGSDQGSEPQAQPQPQRQRNDRRQRTPRPASEATPAEGNAPEIAIASILPPPIMMDTDEMEQAAAAADGE